MISTCVVQRRRKKVNVEVGSNEEPAQREFKRKPVGRD